MKVEPQDGDCWYCRQNDEREELLFCWGFDTYLHLGCLKSHISSLEGDLDPETELIAAEFEKHLTTSTPVCDVERTAAEFKKYYGLAADVSQENRDGQPHQAQ